MTKLTKRDVAQFGRYNTGELSAMFDQLGSRPGDRVKATGFIKLKVAKFGDLLLAEIRRRREAAEG